MENSIELNNGQHMPLLGLGTWKSKPGEVEEAVRVALVNGYRHIDCAFVYGNEAEVGRGIRASGVPREQIFITSKLWNTKHHAEDVEPAVRKTLELLGVDYLDLYLIHWPHGFQRGENNFPKDEAGNLIYDPVDYVETWPAMEALVSKGLVRSIGLSNFNSAQIQRVLDVATIKPAVLQIESHPYFTQIPLITFAKEKGIVVTAYSPLGSPDRPWARPGEPALLEDPKLVEIGTKYGKSPAQIAIRYQIQRGVVVIPKSVTPDRIISNAQVFDFELTEEDMGVVGGFNRDWRACVPMVEVEGVLVHRDRSHPHYPFLSVPF